MLTPDETSIDLEIFIHTIDNFNTRLKRNADGKHFVVIKIGKMVDIHPVGFDLECVDMITLMGRKLILAAEDLKEEILAYRREQEAADEVTLSESGDSAEPPAQNDENVPAYIPATCARFEGKPGDSYCIRCGEVAEVHSKGASDE